jgi:hypothetical protein
MLFGVRRLLHWLNSFAEVGVSAAPKRTYFTTSNSKLVNVFAFYSSKTSVLRRTSEIDLITRCGFQWDRLDDR